MMMQKVLAGKSLDKHDIKGKWGKAHSFMFK